MLPQANQCRRRAVPVSALTVALQCGGSDAWSGITANPALGFAVDLLVAQGGTAVLGETPEIYGAEHLLTQRAVSPEIAEKLIGAGRSQETPVAVIRWGTYEAQQVITGTLSTIADLADAERLRAPSIIVIGDVVRLLGRHCAGVIGPAAPGTA